jgi:hypothetical protein
MIDATSLPAWTRRAVLLYGPRKGGTTLIANLLDGGEELIVFPAELKLKFLIREWLTAGPAAARTYFSHSRVLGRAIPNFDGARYAALVRGGLGSDARDLAELLRADIAAVHACIETKPPEPRLWAMKEVGGDGERILRLFRQLFLDGKVVLILREPRQVTSSVLRDRRRKGRRIGPLRLLREIADPIRALQLQAEWLDDPSVHPLVYENVAGNGLEAELDAVCRYLGIERREVFSRPTLFGQSVVTRTSSRPTTEVFVNREPWTAGMGFAQRMLTQAVHALAPLYYRVRRGRYHVWADVLRQVERRRAAGAAGSPR